MSNWSGGVLTNVGRELQLKVEAGATLTFTKIKLGDGIESLEAVDDLTELMSPKFVMGISSKSVANDVCKITGVLSSSSIATGFRAREWGLFAQDPDIGEILYMISIDTQPDWVPSGSDIGKLAVSYAMNVAVSNASSITARIDPAGLVTADMLAELIHETQYNKSYNVGDYAFTGYGLPAWAYLECIQEGTSGTIELDLSNVVEGERINDGTVVWIVRNWHSIHQYLVEATGYGIVSGLQVKAQDTPNMTVSIEGGTVHMKNGTRIVIAAIAALTIAAADATNPRIDSIYVDGTGNVAYAQGTPAATPVAPTLSTDAIKLADVKVAANQASVTEADIVRDGEVLPRFYNTGIVNVKDFGAVGDGVTDDTQAIQAAIDAAAGRKLVINKGRYKVNTALSISNVEIIADNAEIYAGTSLSEVAKFHGDVKITGLTLDANGVATEVVSNSSDSNDLVLKNCTFTGTPQTISDGGFTGNAAIWINALTAHITNTTVKDNGTHGMRLAPTSIGAKYIIKDSFFLDNGARIQAIGLAQYEPTVGARFESLVIDSCYASGNGASGIAPHSCKNLIITNCVCNNNYEHDICTMDGEGSIIKGNICRDNASFGIRVQGQGRSETDGYKNFVIADNYIVGNGIKLGDTYINNCIIADNVIVNNDNNKYGILLQSTATYDNVSIHDNNIINAGDNNKFIQSQCVLGATVLLKDNMFNGVKTNFYYYSNRSNLYLGMYTMSELKYGTPNNILTAAAGDWSNPAWNILGTVDSNNNLVSGTNGILAEQMVPYTRKPNYVTIYVHLSVLEEPMPALQVQLRFRSANNTMIGNHSIVIQDYSVIGDNIYFTARFVANKINLTDTPAKIGVFLAGQDSGKTYKINNIAMAISNEPPILQS